MPLKIVLDTNILVSSFFWEGKEAELLRKIEQGKAELYITTEILAEFEKVLNRPPFKQLISKANLDADDVLQKTVSISHHVVGKTRRIDVCRDKADNKFLECAKIASAEFIVSGDKDLLVLKRFENIKIVSTGEILQRI